MPPVPRWPSRSSSGAPADVFISADLQWMDYAAEHKLIKPDSRVNLLGNRLVLIAPKDSKLDNVDDRQGLRHRQARRRRPHRGRRRQSGAGRPLCQGGAGNARRLGGGGAEARHGRERARDARLRGARRNADRHRLRDRRQGRAEGEDRRRVSGRLASAGHLSGGGDDGERPTRRSRAISISCARARPRRSSRNTASAS